MASKVSMVIPVKNSPESLRGTLTALRDQSILREQYEIFVVDNGSEDETPEVARSFSDVTLLFERDHPNSPYSARNRGIEEAEGNIIVLLDATCTPEPDWLEKLIKCLKETNSDLVTGDVTFTFEGNVTPAKLVDSTSNLTIEKYVSRYCSAPTGNLAVRRTVFERVGLFPEGVRTGWDMMWTRKAVEAGFQLQFCPQATVRIPAKSLRGVLNKQWRVMQATPMINKHRYKNQFLPQLWLVLWALLPPNPMQLYRVLSERSETVIRRHYLPAYGVRCLKKLAGLGGLLLGYVKWLMGSSVNRPNLSVSSTQKRFQNKNGPPRGY